MTLEWYHDSPRKASTAKTEELEFQTDIRAFWLLFTSLLALLRPPCVDEFRLLIYQHHEIIQLDVVNSTVEPYFTPNSTVQEEMANGLSLNSLMGIFFMCFYIVVYSTSSLGNVVVLYICAKNSRNTAFQPTRTAFFNLYIANLAIADLLFTQLTIFDAVYAILYEWTSGAILCKLQGFLVELCYSAGILTLIAISRERVKSISDLRIKSRIQRVKERRSRSIIAWSLAILLCSPLLYAYNLTEETSNGNSVIRCLNDAWSHLGRRIYYSLTGVILFFTPLLIMIWTQLKIKRVFKSQVAPNQQIALSMRARQRKASRMLGVVTIVFFAFWSPFVFTRTLRYFNWYEGELIWRLSQLLTIASAAANPFIYSFYSTHFRLCIKRFLTCRCGLMAAVDTGDNSTVNSLY